MPHYFVSGVRSSYLGKKWLQIMEEDGDKQICMALVPYSSCDHDICYRDANKIVAGLNLLVKEKSNITD